MKGTLSNIVIFASGALIGSIVTLKIVKNKYERMANEEINSVKEVFARRYRETKGSDSEETFEKVPDGFETSLTKSKPSLKDYYANMVSDLGYHENNNEEEDDEMCITRIIEPEEFEELVDIGYDSDNLTYYADGVLADDFDNVIEDVLNTVGLEFIDIFNETDKDSVFVRNDDLRCDYEIVRDLRKYSDVVGAIPHIAEGE